MGANTNFILTFAITIFTWTKMKANTNLLTHLWNYHIHIINGYFLLAFWCFGIKPKYMVAASLSVERLRMADNGTRVLRCLSVSRGGGGWSTETRVAESLGVAWWRRVEERISCWTNKSTKQEGKGSHPRIFELLCRGNKWACQGRKRDSKEPSVELIMNQDSSWEGQQSHTTMSWSW